MFHPIRRLKFGFMLLHPGLLGKIEHLRNTANVIAGLMGIGIALNDN